VGSVVAGGAEEEDGEEEDGGWEAWWQEGPRKRMVRKRMAGGKRGGRRGQGRGWRGRGWRVGSVVAGGAEEGAFEVTGVWEDTAEGMLHLPPPQPPVPPGDPSVPSQPCSQPGPACVGTQLRVPGLGPLPRRDTRAWAFRGPCFGGAGDPCSREQVASPGAKGN